MSWWTSSVPLSLSYCISTRCVFYEHTHSKNKPSNRGLLLIRQVCLFANISLGLEGLQKPYSLTLIIISFRTRYIVASWLHWKMWILSVNNMSSTGFLRLSSATLLWRTRQGWDNSRKWLRRLRSALGKNKFMCICWGIFLEHWSHQLYFGWNIITPEVSYRFSTLFTHEGHSCLFHLAWISLRTPLKLCSLNRKLDLGACVGWIPTEYPLLSVIL
jgi:hypothetical protein